jgi:hypothetical protein
VQLIYLQNANGSWDLDEGLAKVLRKRLEDIQAAHPAEVKVKVKHRSKCVFDAVRLVKRIGV